MSTVAIRVFLLDDHEIVRTGLRSLIETQDDMSVVGEAASVQEALSRIPPIAPDVAVLDVRLPDGTGIDVCREVRSTLPRTACLMLTSYRDDEALFAAVMAGAAGYVLKQVGNHDLISDIRTVAAGQSLIDENLAAKVMERMTRRSYEEDRLVKLTAQERRILEGISKGLTNRQIADEMFLAEKTVKNYVSNLLSKLGMQRRTEAAVYAARLSERRAERNAAKSADSL